MLKSESVRVGEDAGQSEWPYCPVLRGECIVFDSPRLLGLDIYEALITFITSAEAGSRLTLQKNKNEFTLQVTGAVYRSNERPFNASDLKLLRLKLDGLRGGNDKDASMN